MEIFGIGPLEFLLIIIIMLLVLGPEEMLNTARKIGAFIRQIVRSPMWGDVMDTSREIRNLPNRIIQETGLEDEISEIKQVAQAPKQMLDEAAKQLNVEMEPIVLPKIDIKSALSSPDKTDAPQKNTSSIESDQIVDSTAISPENTSESLQPEAAPIDPSTGDEDAVPLQVEYETTPINTDSAESDETVDSTPHPLAVEFVEPAAENLVKEQDTDVAQPADAAPIEKNGASAPEQIEAGITPPTKRRTRKTRKSSEDDPTTKSEKLIAESMTPHENGGPKDNG